MTSRALLYVHSPRPPYERIAGPIYPSSLSHTIGLSVQSNAEATVSVEDIHEEWLRPGMCWFLDQSDIGEDDWAGFVERETLSFRSPSVTIPLIGPKEGLLTVEIAVRLPVPVSKGFAVKRVLEIAQELDIGLYPGRIEQEGAAVTLDVRGETVSQFLDTIKEASAVDWLERCALRSDNTLAFYIDFGLLRHPTNIILEAADLIEGTNEFIRNPVVSSLTILGQAGSFAERSSASTGAHMQGSHAQPLDAEAVQLVQGRLVGPAAGRHAIEISERFGTEQSSLSSYIFERHLELLRGVDQVTLTLDALRTNVQRVHLGDIVQLIVPNWSLSLNVDAQIHIREIRPDAAGGKREIVADVLP